jgi:lysylphosphatidylglycerol synthetase-like protein (DUF2156 family)
MLILRYMYQYILAIHIFGSFITASLIILNFISPKFTKSIWLMGLLQILSGVVLSMLVKASFGESCLRLGAYLFVIFIFQAIFFIRGGNLKALN